MFPANSASLDERRKRSMSSTANADVADTRCVRQRVRVVAPAERRAELRKLRAVEGDADVVHPFVLICSLLAFGTALMLERGTEEPEQKIENNERQHCRECLAFTDFERDGKDEHDHDNPPDLEYREVAEKSCEKFVRSGGQKDVE